MNEIKKINVDGVDYDIVAKELTKTTYAELKALRDNGQLSEGHLYRITDYVTTTVQTNTKSAGNVFDVIVLAVSASELSHIARAIQHEGDTYFDGNDLGAWELWYDLDNDTEKYEWADATNGKGVIYRMIDEKRNDCPYDFKNILFYNTKIAYPATGDQYYYTFSYVVSGNLFDGTVAKQVTTCYSNSMRMYFYDKKRLNKNVFRNKDFGHLCYSNTLGLDCYYNTFGANCYTNTFKDRCNTNVFGDGCMGNTFGTTCYANTFVNDCDSNTFGSNCFGNIFGSGCSYNILRDHCGSNVFGNNCSYNIFGGACYDNHLRNYCNYNIFGNYCRNNTFGDSYQYRHLDNAKTSITLNDEYYDDGSGQLVPIKHPNLSTQPSILPYKFMGQYVYEQLIPIAATNIDVEAETSMYLGYADELGLTVDKRLLILEANMIIIGYKDNYLQSATCPVTVNVDDYSRFPKSILGIKHDIITIKNFEGAFEKPTQVYLKVRYTTLVEEANYYGYTNYGGGQ